MKKIIAAAMAVFLGITALTACGDKEESSSGGGMLEGGQNIPDGYSLGGEEMEYGASVVELKPETNENVRVMIGFDKRFFSEEEYEAIYRISDYIAAINENDHELFGEIFYDGYLDYVAEQNGMEDADAHIDSFETTLTESLGEDFEIDYIDVSACYDAEDSASASTFEQADKILAELAGDEILDKIDYRRVVEIGGNTTYKTPTGDYLFTNHERPFMLCIYRIDGEYYLF
ncbi:MAG: hypothetical protein J6D27_00030 [Ruminiclostridium sp.]|nr:hypothetical protein [Ruminococcus sp.]MBP3921342.1 hypothetical protein [Ruminiclostridium sp.]